MTYTVLIETLNHAQSNQSFFAPYCISHVVHTPRKNQNAGCRKRMARPLLLQSILRMEGWMAIKI